MRQTTILSALLGLAAGTACLPAGTASAATYYVGPSATGNGSGSDRSDLMAFNTFKNSTAHPGDIALLQVGNYSACDCTFRPENNQGKTGSASGGHIIYRADPNSPGYEPRPSNWWRESIPRPTPEHSAFFNDGLYLIQAGGPKDFYLTFDGLAVTYVWFRWYVAHVNVLNCVVYGSPPADPTPYHYGYAERVPYGIDLYDNGHACDIHSIHVENCYVSGHHWGLSIRNDYSTPPAVGEDIYFVNCHVTDECVDGIHFGRPASITDTILIDHCNIDTYYAAPDPQIHESLTVEQHPYGEDPMCVKYSGTETNERYFAKAVHVVDGQPQTAWRGGINNISAKTFTITCGHAWPWTLSPGDTFELWGNSHGAGIHLDCSGLTVRNTMMRGFGATGSVYSYHTGYTDLTFENCVFYGDNNNARGVISLANTNSAGVGERVRIVNCTLIGTRRSDYVDQKAFWHHYYGQALDLDVASGHSTADWVIANNLFVGEVTLPTTFSGVCVKNHAYCSVGSYSYFADGVNGNVVTRLYSDQTNPPNPLFDVGVSPAYFVGDPNMNNMLHGLSFAWRNTDFYDGLHLASSSPAKDAGSAASGCHTVTDFDGNARDSAPDIGAFEYAQGAPPGPTADPNPADKQTGVSAYPTLTWSVVPTATSYHVWLDGSVDAETVVTEANEASPCYLGSVSSASYEIGTALEPSTTYRWKVIPHNGYGSPEEGIVVWSFSTAPSPDAATDPDPAHRATHVPITAVLSWTGTSDATYDVYLNVDLHGSLQKVNEMPLTETHFSYPGLTAGRAYAWRVDTIRAQMVTPGPTWEFFTVSPRKKLLIRR